MTKPTTIQRRIENMVTNERGYDIDVKSPYDGLTGMHLKLASMDCRKERLAFYKSRGFTYDYVI
jgi:hypothetical protein